MQNIQNTLYTGDNLFILNGLNSKLIDLIYLDPPFNTKRTYSAPIASKSSGASFKDMWTWKDVNDAYLENLIDRYPSLLKFIQCIGGIHSKAMMSYIIYMTQRIIEMHRILKDSGSLYVHVDPTASHYLKIVLDEIFGKQNFRNEIIWGYRTGGSSKKKFSKKHDILFYYTKTKNFTFNMLKEKNYTKSKYRKEGIINYGQGNTEFFRDENGVYNLINMRDIWNIPYINSQSKERTGYPTQKPLALLNRIIKAGSNEGDLILDPFCGCATTCVSAQKLNRKWIGIDIEKKSVDVLINRLSDDAGLFKNFIHTEKIPQRTDIEIVSKNSSVKERLYKQQKGKCNGCNNPMRIIDFDIDHIIPKSKGASDHYENYQLLCGNCNKVKGNRPMEYLRTKIKAKEDLLNKQLSFGD